MRSLPRCDYCNSKSTILIEGQINCLDCHKDALIYIEMKSDEIFEKDLGQCHCIDVWDHPSILSYECDDGCCLHQEEKNLFNTK